MPKGKSDKRYTPEFKIKVVETMQKEKYNFCNGTKSEYTYYTQNAHDDVVNLTDKDGKVTKKYTYDAFGVEKNIDKNDTNAFRYCGEYFGSETRDTVI